MEKTLCKNIPDHRQRSPQTIGLKQKIQVEIDTTQNKELTIPILFVDNTTQQNFLVTGFPTTYVIDEEGLVYTAMIGYFKEYDEWMSMLLNNMLITK